MLLSAAAAEAAQPVGRVLEAKGRILVADGVAKGDDAAKGRELATLDTLYLGQKMTLEVNASLLLAFRADGHLERIAGPGEVTVGKAGCQPASQVAMIEAPQRHKQLVNTTIRALQATGASGAMIVRSAPASPTVHRTVSLEDVTLLAARPKLHWPPLAWATGYQVVVRLDGAKVWASALTAQAEADCPAEVALKAGAMYAWDVFARPADGPWEHAYHGTFTPATDEQKATARELQELAAGSEVPYLTLAATWHEENGLPAEAIALYERLTVLEPHEASYCFALARLFHRVHRDAEAEKALAKARQLKPLTEKPPRPGWMLFGRDLPPPGADSAPDQPAAAHKPAGADKPAEPVALRRNDPGFLVRADVNRASRSYREGDNLSITVASEADAYVYVLYRQADGKVFLIFPNSTQPVGRLRARQAAQIPAADDLFRWSVAPPLGKEIIKVIASKEPLEELADPAFREKFFNAVPQKNLKGIELELGKKEFAWAEDTVEINTYAADDKLDRATARRVGLFIGLGKYEHGVAGDALTPAVAKMVLHFRPGHRDARTLAGVFQEVGRLNTLRILADDEATRGNVEQAVTQWLPAVSRPGDTVLIFFSGLAFPLSEGQTAGAPPEVLLPLYDFVFPGVLQTLAQKQQAGKIGRGESQLLAYTEQLAQRGGPAAVYQEWAIPDHQFAHWLQMLAGRQIVVILDAPYASAFGPGGFVPAAAAAGTPPLAGGVARLQELGQRDIAILGACGGARFDVCRDPDSLSLLTELLAQCLQAAPGQLTLEQAHAEVAQKMAARLEEYNARLRAQGKEPEPPYQPYLTNTCTQPILLKP
jgi:hypothetical protein